MCKILVVNFTHAGMYAHEDYQNQCIEHLQHPKKHPKSSLLDRTPMVTTVLITIHIDYFCLF